MINKDPEKQKKSNPLVAVAAGVAIGAGITAAGAALLQDKQRREKVKGVVKDVKNHVADYVEDIQKKGNEKKEEGKEKLDLKKDELKSKAVASIDSAQDALEKAKKNM